MELVKQCIGIDISKDSFTACYCARLLSGELEFSQSIEFKNEKTGFNQLLRWVKGVSVKDVELVFLMEATGVYYERLAYHLHRLNKTTHVVLPNKAKNYFSSLNIKTKTDSIDARYLSQFGTERKHKKWGPPSEIMVALKAMCRYKHQLKAQLVSLKNQQHSRDFSEQVQQFIKKNNRTLLTTIEKQISKTDAEIIQLIQSDKDIEKRVNQVSTIKGCSNFTVIEIIAETNGFENFTSIKHVVSFAGLDVVQKESGTSVKGTTRISKKGNSHIRNALFFPAMTACRHNLQMKESYIRIIQNKPSKMIGQVAIQRKMLALIYSLWKSGEVYDPNYKKVAPVKTEATQDS